MGGDLGRKVVHSSITETESMEKFRSSVFWLKGRKSRHQFQINRENYIRIMTRTEASLGRVSGSSCKGYHLES